MLLRNLFRRNLGWGFVDVIPRIAHNQNDTLWVQAVTYKQSNAATRNIVA